jgi:hypothetical protein
VDAAEFVELFVSGARPQWAPAGVVDWYYNYATQQGTSFLGFPPGTDTHAATIEAQQSTGVWVGYPANVPVITNLGLQTVPTRTNSIRNSAASGATSAPSTMPTNWFLRTPGAGLGTVALTVVGTGTDPATGLPYVDLRWAGTMGATGNFFFGVYFESGSQISAMVGQTWACSVTGTLLGGSFAGLINVGMGLDARDSGGAYLNTILSSGASGAFTPTATPTRVAAVATTTNASTAYVQPYFNMTGSAGLVVDVTIRFSVPQLELGSFASPPILTTGTAATVNGNQQVIGLTGKLSQGVAGIVQIDTKGLADEKYLFELNDGTTDNQVSLRTTANSTVYRFSGAVSGSSVGGINFGSPAVGVATFVFAVDNASKFAQVRQVGQPANTAATLSGYPLMSKIALGGTGTTASNNTYQLTKKLALKFGPQDQNSFNQMYTLAQIAAASP